MLCACLGRTKLEGERREQSESQSEECAGGCGQFRAQNFVSSLQESEEPHPPLGFRFSSLSTELKTVSRQNHQCYIFSLLKALSFLG